MISYLDTSALVKLYIEETGTDLVQEFANKSKILATSIVAYAEARAAFKRGLNEKIIEDKKYSICCQNLRNDWNHYLKVNIDNHLILLAGDLAERHNIRGFDSIHMASAIILKTKVNINDIVFLCWDKKLLEAAIKEGLATNH